jgi:hypothetical protein
MHILFTKGGVMVMWPEIYNFFEQFAGVSFNFIEDLQALDGNAIFIETYEWQTKKDDILENLQDALDCIEENGQYLGEDMPSKQDLKKIVASYVLSELVKDLNSIKQTLNIEVNDIASFDDLENQLYVISMLVEMLANNSLDTLLAENLFATYITEEEDDDNEFETVLGLSANDVPNLSFTVTSIREDYFESLNEDEE